MYGLIAMALKSGRLPGFEAPLPDIPLASTFINRNSFATYAGIGLVIISGYLAQLYEREMTRGRRVRIALLLESAGRKAAPLLAAGFVMAVALLLTGSRGGVAATLLGLTVLVLLSRGGIDRKSHRAVLSGIALLVGTAIVYAFGNTLVGGFEERGVLDSGRIAVALLTLRSIIDAPLLGYGYGTFADVFPLYRDHSIGVQGAWDQAHNTYLEVFQGLGLVFGALLVASVVLLVLRCVNGALTRKEHRVVPRVAVAAACLVGAHSMVDFSLQIQAIALTFIAVLAGGVAQSTSSRLALED
jgi:O-antigen ligase